MRGPGNACRLEGALIVVKVASIHAADLALRCWPEGRAHLRIWLRSCHRRTHHREGRAPNSAAINNLAILGDSDHWQLSRSQFESYWPWLDKFAASSSFCFVNPTPYRVIFYLIRRISRRGAVKTSSSEDSADAKLAGALAPGSAHLALAPHALRLELDALVVQQFKIGHLALWLLAAGSRAAAALLHSL